MMRWTRIGMAALAACVLVGGGALALKPSARAHARYTDGRAIRVAAQGAPLRMVLWKPAEVIAGAINTGSDEYEPRLSADGTVMVFVRGRAGANAELYEARWTPAGWSEARPIASVNTPGDELGPELSADGEWLYFYSDRPGGLGGFDLYRSRRNGAEGANDRDRLGDSSVTGTQSSDSRAPTSPRGLGEVGGTGRGGRDRLGDSSVTGTESSDSRAPTSPRGLGEVGGTGRESRDRLEDSSVTGTQESAWGEAVNLGPAVNSAFNEYGPALTPGGERLYFSSNRPRPGEAAVAAEGWPATVREVRGRHDYDLYEAGMEESGPAVARAVVELNTDADEGAPAVSPAGDFVYFASDRSGGSGGFDLYRSRMGGRDRDRLGDAPVTGTESSDSRAPTSPRGLGEVGGTGKGGRDRLGDSPVTGTERATYGPVESVGGAVNSAFNDLDPALSADGFRLTFSSDRPVDGVGSAMAADGPRDYGLWMSGSREVYLEVDPRAAQIAWARAWERLWPWLLLLLTSLLGSLLLARFARRSAWARNGKLGLLARCVIFSFAVHLVVASLLAVWRVGTTIGEMMREGGGAGGGMRVMLASSGAGDSIGRQIRGGVGDGPAIEPVMEVGERAAAPRLEISAGAARLEPELAAIADGGRMEARVEPGAAPVAERALPPVDAAMSVMGVMAVESALPPEAGPSEAVREARRGETPLVEMMGPRAEVLPAGGLSAARVVVGVEDAGPAVSDRAAMAVTVGPAARAVEVEAAPARVGAGIGVSAAGAADVAVPVEERASAGPAGEERSERAAIDALSGAGLAGGPRAEISGIAGPAGSGSVRVDPAGESGGAGPAGGLDAGAARMEVSAGPSEEVGSAAGVIGPAGPAGVPGVQLGGAEVAIPSEGVGERDGASGGGEARLSEGGAVNLAEIGGGRAGITGLGAVATGSSSRAVVDPVGPAVGARGGDGPSLKVGIADSKAGADGAGPAIARLMPGVALDLGGGDGLRLPEVEAEDAPPAPVETFAQRDPDPEVRGEMLERMGGSRETERAVTMALRWLAAHQEADGRWSGRGFDDGCGECGGPAEIESDTAITGMALLCYLGAGHTHVSEGEYRGAVSKGMGWLLAREAGRGDLRRGETMYAQTIASVALCEALAMTRDPALAGPARRAVAVVMEGVGRSGARRSDDTSVLGWQVMAVESARRAGIEVSGATLAAAERFLDRVSERGAPGRYAYTPGGRASAAMTAEAMFVRQLIGHGREEARMGESARFILETPPRWNAGAPTYYWYYATLALFQQQGEAWTAWNEALAPELLNNQRRDGHAAGSWDPQDEWSRLGGRIYQTAVCTLSLEVYYRYRPAGMKE
ncbi:MAG: PD40 domain-containing protein [Phycisphaerales bacterium]|nr:PD40 domain-containing protein [Phycisphaerales bacterium]